ncbi:MAG TPA: sigma-70 family RNA polymerase sigma factor [Chitinophagaceae bacterium]|nr:sigma-70 family RNA polymerase sigma factor [Chitinophagaceae bacterium]
MCLNYSASKKVNDANWFISEKLSLPAFIQTSIQKIAMALTGQEDAELLVQFRNAQTKETAFTAIIKKYQEKLYWHVRRMVVDHEDANDVLQNAFIRIWNGLENFKEESQLYTWLYRIATNESLTFLEGQKKRSAVSLSDVESGLSNKIKADKHFDPNKLEWKLQLAIQQLPEKQRLVFSLRYYDEMPYEEMSRVLDTSEGALKASYHHAVKKIEDYIVNH